MLFSLYLLCFVIDQFYVYASPEDVAATKIQTKYRNYHATLRERAYLKSFSFPRDLKKHDDPISNLELRLAKIGAEDPGGLPRKEPDLEAGDKFGGDIKQFMNQLDQVTKINTQAEKCRDYHNLAEYAYWTKRYDLAAKIRAKHYSQFATVSYKGFQYKTPSTDHFVVDLEWPAGSYHPPQTMERALEIVGYGEGAKIVSEPYLSPEFAREIKDLEVDSDGFAYFYKAVGKNQLCKIKNGGLDSKFGGRKGATQISGLTMYEGSDSGKQFMCDKYSTARTTDINGKETGYSDILKKSGGAAVLLVKMPTNQSHLYNFAHGNGSWIIAGTKIPPEYLYVEAENEQSGDDTHNLKKEVVVSNEWESPKIKKNKIFAPLTTIDCSKY
jgi:hypothetical protein